MTVLRHGSWVGVVWIALAGVANGAETAPDFATEVLPVLTRAGCNAGACHGAAIGRGAFRLSLFASDPQADYASIVEEYKGRRIHLARPDESLLLRKPAGELSHGGGRRLPVNEEGHARVLTWLRAGAPPSSSRALQTLELTPTTQWLSRPDERFTLRAVAHFNDGSKADVTRWAVVTPTDPAALDCTGNGEVTALRRGQHELLVRFMGAVGCVTVVVPYHDAPPTGERPRANLVDDHINRVLDRLPHAPRADDATLARRCFIDLLGQLPEPEEVEAFFADSMPDKWTRLIDRLIERPEFVDYWSYQWGDLLRIESGRLRPEGAAAFHGWVREQVRRNTPLDQFARELVLAGGDSYRNGPANFSRVPADARAEAEYVGQVFLGVRIQCANCHNHPLDRWTQDDYHGLAAVFARVGRGREVGRLPRGEVIHPRTGQPATSRIPGVRDLADDGDGDPREALAAWLTDRNNPYFARAAVNRVWRALMGRGLVESPDDHRATNPATHPELLDQLASDFVAHGFDLRHTLRTILASEAYRRSAAAVEGNRMDDRFYSRALVRALPPPVLVDAVARVTGVPEKLGDLPPGTRAVALGDARVPSQPLDLLGRCGRRDADCSTPQAVGGSLPLVLHAINGPWLNAKVRNPDSSVGRLLRENRTDAEVVTDLYRAAVGRRPTDKELGHWLPRLKATSADERWQKFEDFLWAMLNSTEFGTNH